MQRFLRAAVRLRLTGLITVSLAALMAYLLRAGGDDGPVRAEMDSGLFPQVELVEVSELSGIDPVGATERARTLPEIDDRTARLPAESGLAGVELPSVAGPDGRSGSRERARFDVAAMIERRVLPDYPIRALERGLEGYCQLEFDVGPDGTPINVGVNDCSHTIFERNSVRAVERWRYSPQIRDGLAVTQTGLRTRIDFNLDD
ncbi:energy transducer TonB [Hyphobacterium sp.]|uniref:energy transducer TonB n=1 Tax=Hyphobacterium sp. TaxID=2004662 RepID=UPI003B5170B8